MNFSPAQAKNAPHLWNFSQPKTLKNITLSQDYTIISFYINTN
jgi:hypothetical protein